MVLEPVGCIVHRFFDLFEQFDHLLDRLFEDELLDVGGQLVLFVRQDLADALAVLGRRVARTRRGGGLVGRTGGGGLVGGTRQSEHDEPREG